MTCREPSRPPKFDARPVPHLRVLPHPVIGSRLLSPPRYRQILMPIALGSKPNQPDRFGRIADVADRGLGRLNWAESAPTKVASGRTGIRAIAVVPLHARSRLHRPKHAFIGAGQTPLRAKIRSGPSKPSAPEPWRRAAEAAASVTPRITAAERTRQSWRATSVRRIPVRPIVLRTLHGGVGKRLGRSASLCSLHLMAASGPRQVRVRSTGVLVSVSQTDLRFPPHPDDRLATYP